jgi:hypothetical protein
VAAVLIHSHPTAWRCVHNSPSLPIHPIYRAVSHPEAQRLDLEQECTLRCEHDVLSIPWTDPALKLLNRSDVTPAKHTVRVVSPLPAV